MQKDEKTIQQYAKEFKLCILCKCITINPKVAKVLRIRREKKIARLFQRLKTYDKLPGRYKQSNKKY